jgi:hypothetical protein
MSNHLLTSPYYIIHIWGHKEHSPVRCAITYESSERAIIAADAFLRDGCIGVCVSLVSPIYMKNIFDQ